MKLQGYPIVSSNIVREIEQPLYSTFIYEYEKLPYPIYLNTTAANIFRLCDGTRTMEDICVILAKNNSCEVSEVVPIVTKFVEQAQQYRHIELQEHPNKDARIIKNQGSKDYWTPELLSIELTTKCPLHCKHCYVNAGIGTSIDSNLLKSIIDQAKTLGIQELQFTGGEPLLYRNLSLYVQEALDAGCKIQIFTSGYFYDEQTIAQFKKFVGERLYFQVSLDGLEKYHDTFRGVKGSFFKATTFLEQVHNMGFQTTVGTTIDSQNYLELQNLCQHCKKIGVSVLRLGTITNQGRAEENKLERDDDKIKFLETTKHLLKANEETNSFKIFLAEEKDQNASILKNCGLGQTLLKVSPEGLVFPCLMSTMCIGNLNNNSIAEIQRRTSRLFENIESPGKPTCTSCKYCMLCDRCIVEGLLHCDNLAMCAWKKSCMSIFAEIRNNCYYE